MIPSENFIRNSMKEIKKNRIVFAFYREQQELLQSICDELHIILEINNNGWLIAIFKKEELE